MATQDKNSRVRWLLQAGTSSSALYVVMLIVVPLLWPDYSSITQTVSELSAVNAPTRMVWFPLGILYGVLVTFFGWGVWQSAHGSKALRVTGWLMIFYGIVCILWPFAPMHLREVLAAGGSTWSDTAHLTFAGVAVALMLASMAFSAAAYGKIFRWYVIVSMVTLAVCGLLTAAESPDVEKNLPTPLIGVWERINILVFLVWVVVVTVLQLRASNDATSSTS